MLLVLFAGCGNTSDDKQTTPSTTSSESQPATTEPETTTEESFDFDGYEFTITNGGAFPRKGEDGKFASATDEEWNELYLELENKYNIKIVHVPLSGDKLEILTSYGMAGDKAADLFFCRQPEYWSAGKSNHVLPVSEGILMDLGLNPFDETRWYQPAVEATKCFDKYWGVQVASKFIAVPSGYFITFNKNLAAEAGYDDLYAMVRNKTWTYDVYMDIAIKTTKDTDGDGQIDVWGTGATAWGNEILTNGVDYVGQDENGRWTLTADSKAGLEALQFLYDMNYGSNTRWNESSGVVRQGFADGKVTFNYATMGNINGPGQMIYNSNHDYGILPIPLGPSGTEYVAGHANNDVYVIQASNKDLDKVVPIMNAWALIVNDTESYLEMLDDGRCRTAEDKEMMVEYIIPKFGLCNRKINNAIDDLLADEFIASFSYGGFTPSQSIETYRDRIQSELDAFFND